mmetsp:Transcript_30014/g.92620  ORF Transcript_30014/g.92620 Transcript_30014/m.92620 type:complete len:226 (+) Transcript_30014:336-1013(+)
MASGKPFRVAVSERMWLKSDPPCISSIAMKAMPSRLTNPRSKCTMYGHPRPHASRRASSLPNGSSLLDCSPPSPARVVSPVASVTVASRAVFVPAKAKSTVLLNVPDCSAGSLMAGMPVRGRVDSSSASLRRFSATRRPSSVAASRGDAADDAVASNDASAGRRRSMHSNTSAAEPEPSMRVTAYSHTAPPWRVRTLRISAGISTAPLICCCFRHSLWGSELAHQ